MAKRIVWSPEAADDLEQIVLYIARDSPRYGRQVATDVIEAIERVAESPGRGRILREFDIPTIRDVLVYSYRVIYRVDREAIHVAAIIHAARDLLKALEGRDV